MVVSRSVELGGPGPLEGARYFWRSRDPKLTSATVISYVACVLDCSGIYSEIYQGIRDIYDINEIKHKASIKIVTWLNPSRSGEGGLLGRGSGTSFETSSRYKWKKRVNIEDSAIKCY